MKLTELAKAIEGGKQIEVDTTSRSWLEFNYKSAQICELQELLHFDKLRIKPEKKPIDLSVLIESGIDCIFWDGSIGVLSEISSGPQYHMRIGTEKSHAYTPYSECKPRMDHWHSWQGGDCPLPEGLVVEANMLLANGQIKTQIGVVHGLNWCDNWKWMPGMARIISFKVIDIECTHCWPWEIDQS